MRSPMKMLFSATVTILLFSHCKSAKPAAALPSAEYTLAYRQDFSNASLIRNFEVTDPSVWRINESGKTSMALECTGKASYEPKVRSPHSIALISGKKFGSFVLEADLLQTGKEYGHRDLCIIFGFQNPSQFYYVHMASKADPNAHNIFVVNNVPRTNIGKMVTEGLDWGQNAWHHVRLERDVAVGKIRVFFDDMTKPIMEAEDKSFGAGMIGFGTFDDSGKYDNIRIWSTDASADTRTGIFKQ